MTSLINLDLFESCAFFRIVITAATEISRMTAKMAYSVLHDCIYLKYLGRGTYLQMLNNLYNLVQTYIYQTCCTNNTALNTVFAHYENTDIIIASLE